MQKRDGRDRSVVKRRWDRDVENSKNGVDTLRKRDRGLSTRF